MSRPVSIVVNTYNRGESLRRTLESFSQLEYPAFEVVVVNGPSTDGTGEVLEEFAGRIKVGHCPHTNLSESRNVGVGLAAGEIVAFIDDDAYPDPSWLDRLVEGYDHDEVAAVGGPVYDHTGAALQARYTFGTRLGDARVGIAEANPTPFLNSPWTEEFVNTLGTNASFRRDRLVEIGGFDEEFEYYLDENSVCLRLIERGWVVKAIDDGFVYHKFLPSDVRGENRAARNRYQVIKSKCYFALKHGLATHSFYEVCENLLEFVRGSRDEYRWCVDNRLLTEEDFRNFESDIHAAFDRAMQNFASGIDRTRPATWFSERQEPFLPFPVERSRAEKLHVCFLSQEYPPGPVNGIARFVHTLATALAREGHLIRVLTRGEHHHRVDLEEGVWVHRVVVDEHTPPASIAVPPALWNHSASMLAELRRIHDHRPVDLVQGPNWDNELLAVILSGVFTSVLSLHTPLATVRDVEPAVVAGNADVDDMLLLDRLCLEQANALLANGEAVIAAIEDRYGVALPRERVAVIPHGVPDPAEAGVASSGDGDGSVEVLFVGRLERRKGIDTLLAAIPGVAAAFPDVRFAIVGDDTIPSTEGVPYRVSFERTADPAVLDRVEFTGIVSDEELRRRYERCSIFVAPSRFESFGLVAAEAMAFGKPVVAGDNAGLRSVVEDGSNGYLVGADDPTALEEALASLLASPALREQFGARSRELFEERFAVATMAAATLKFYEGVLETRYALERL
jgi:glycogen synthase